MNITPWRTKTEGRHNGGAGLARVRDEMDQLFEQFFRDPWAALARGPAGAGLLMDVAEDEKEITVTADLPGVEPKDIDIDVTGNTLTIRAERKQEREEKERDYYFSERSYGRFHRSIELPNAVDPDKVDAVYHNGTLTLKLGKTAEAQRKRIQVKEA